VEAAAVGWTSRVEGIASPQQQVLATLRRDPCRDSCRKPPSSPPDPCRCPPDPLPVLAGPLPVQDGASAACAGRHVRMCPVRPDGRHARHHHRQPGPVASGRSPHLRHPPAAGSLRRRRRRPQPRKETWRQHRARVTATAAPVVDDARDELAESGTEQLRAGTPVAVTVIGTARGADGWTAAMTPYRLDCLTVQDPPAGWLVDDVAVTAPPPAPAQPAG